jgi:hypothetical protein
MSIRSHMELEADSCCHNGKEHFGWLDYQETMGSAEEDAGVITDQG